MELPPLTLGQALATLAATERSINFSANGALPAPVEDAHLNTLRIRLRTMRGANATAGAWQALPERCCEATSPFLVDNYDFFLRGIFFPARIETDDGYDTRLFKHLNDCYWCFDEFCQVMRDYYNKSQELLQTN